jgi:exopolysaccharide biosynthesis protein
LGDDIKSRSSKGDQHRGDTKAKKRKKKKKGRSVTVAIIIDLVIAALALYIFSLYYFILPQDLSDNAQTLPGASGTPIKYTAIIPLKTKEPELYAEEPTPTAVQDDTMWGAKFTGMFTEGEAEITETSYKSDSVSISIEKVQTDGITYYVADIYLKDLQSFKTAFAKGKFGKGLHEGTDEIAADNNAILAINGDYYGNNAGPVVRNGVLYREEKYKDVLVMNYDGSMQTFSARELDMDKIKSEGAYQIWTFGPMLLNDGQPMTTFDSDLTRANPRTAIGYYEPGHYCFVVVDGRQPGYSKGMTLQQMSELFYNLGCKVAYNLDGGQSSEMVFRNEFVNQPYKGGRSVSDIVYIAEGE